MNRDRTVLTYRQATDIVDRLAEENAAALHPAPRLEAMNTMSWVPCSGPDDDQDTGDVMAERAYWLRGIDPSLNEDIFRQLRRYWSDRDYRVTLEDGNSSRYRVIAARHPDNDFTVDLTEGHGVLSLGVQSGCVPAPESGRPVRPSSQWSAAAPAASG